MRIETIRVRNYKAFADLELKHLPELGVFIGANGTGKTTLFDVFGFLRDALRNNVKQALDKRGGWSEVVTRGSEGPISIELQFRLKIAGRERLVTYLLEIVEAKGRPVIAKEVLRYKRGRYGSPYRFLDFAYGEGYAIRNEEDFSKPDEELEREQQSLQSPDILAIKGLGQFERFKAATAFRTFIESWQVLDFHISDARLVRDAGYAEHLSATGDNLPLVAQYLHEEHPEVFARVLARMSQRIPGVEDVVAEKTIDGRIVLRFRDGAFADPFIARFVSDGTIKMFAYLLLLHDPRPHPLLCIEEPENQLYPGLLPELLEEFREYAQRGGQVFVTTHSPDLLNAATPEEVFWLAKRDGLTHVRRASDQADIVRFAAGGDQLGALWKQRYFVGAEPN